MISFKQFLITEEKIKQSKNTLQKLIKECVEQFRSDLKKAEETQVKPLSIIVLESVDKMVDADLHQTDKDVKALKRFERQYQKLSEKEKVELVKKLSEPINGKGYIENNNEVKLILIYKMEPNSYAGQEAYNAVVLNKQGLFKSVANKKVQEKKMTIDQAADYVSEMFATLCGGGMYNDKNGGAFSLDAYDPYSGVPFNSFLKEKVIPSAYNRFQATYNKSISNDYVGQKEGTSVVSTDKVKNAGDSDDRDLTELDFIQDTSENGRTPEDLTDEKFKKQLLEKVLTGVGIPPEYKLNEKEVQVIKLVELENMPLKEVGKKLGYKDSTAVPNVKRYQYSAMSKLKKAVAYLMKSNTFED